MVHPDNISRELVPSAIVSSNVEGIVVKAIDVDDDFNNKQEFDNRESMLTWIRRNATNLGFDAVIGRSDNGTTRRNTFVTMLYKRSGKYHPTIEMFKRDDTVKMLRLKFVITCWLARSGDFGVICGLHNHDLCKKLQGHPSACPLNPEEKTCINEISLNLVQPKHILVTLKQKEPDNISNIRQVCNIWYRNNKTIRGDISEMQQLLKMLDDNKYVSQYRTRDNGVTVRDIFWIHPDSIKLFNTFATALLLNSTYKTNKYRLPLFEMVGVTSTEKTYAVDFDFLECEKKDNFRWTLDVCGSLLKEQVEIPKAIFTNRDTTLKNAVAKVFPSSNALLCRYHITCNVRSKVKPTVGTKQVEIKCGKSVKPV